MGESSVAIKIIPAAVGEELQSHHRCCFGDRWWKLPVYNISNDVGRVKVSWGCFFMISNTLFTSAHRTGSRRGSNDRASMICV